jgi:hypothetical protein
MTSEKDTAVRRLQQALEAVATFARIREQLLLRQKTTPIGRPREQIDNMIRLNRETLDAARMSLSLAEADVLRKSSACTTSSKPAHP